MRSLLFVILTIFLALSGCTEHDVAGGTGSETVSVFTGTVKDVDGTPAAHVSVYLIDEAAWYERTVLSQSASVDSTQTDSLGNFTLATSSNGLHTIQAIRDGFTALHDGYAASGITGSAGTLRLDTCASAEGNTQSGTSVVSLKGTMCRSSVGPSGHFSITNIPAGSFALFTDANYCGGVDASAGEAISLDTLLPETAGILVDDFNDGTAISPLRFLIPGASWNMWLGEGAMVLPAEADSAPSLLMQSDATSDGNYLHLVMPTDSSAPRCHGGVACDLAPKNLYIDGSGISTISFNARGKGSFICIIGSAAADSIAGSGTTQFRTSFNPDSSWTTFSIPADSLKPPIDAPLLAGRTWRDISRSIRTIGFRIDGSPGDTFTLDIDNVRLNGLSAESLLNPHAP